MDKIKPIGRKIESHHENPIDDVLLDMCEESLDFCKVFGITPNMITIFRFILGIFVLKQLFTTCDYITPIIGTALFYFLDCVDGHLARSTNQVTVLGDYLDHIADTSFFIVLLVWIIKQQYPYKKQIIIIFLIIFYMSLVHLGLQQKNFALNREETCSFPKESLDYLNHIHSLDHTHICWTKYFGLGTIYFILLIIIYYIQTNISKCSTSFIQHLSSNHQL
jgi:hypothetical protein